MDGLVNGSRHALPATMNFLAMYKRAIIIGASSGIGKALATTLAREGSLVGVTGRRQERLLALQKQFPEQIFPCSFDVTELKHSIKCVKQLIEQIGGLDLFVYCSGQGGRNEYLDYKIDHEILSVNITAFTNIMNYVFNFMQNQNAGQIVNISSVAGLRGHHLHAAYHASKAYQCNYLEGLRKKSTKEKLAIGVTDIRPGFIQTEHTVGRPSYLLYSVDKASKQIYRSIKKFAKVSYVPKRYALLALLMKIFPCALWDRCP